MTPKHKACRRMWAYEPHLECLNVHLTAKKGQQLCIWPKERVIPVAVLDLRPEAVEAMVEKANQVLTRSFFGTIGVPKDECIREARAVLTAILGPLPARKKEAKTL